MTDGCDGAFKVNFRESIQSHDYFLADVNFAHVRFIDDGFHAHLPQIGQAHQGEAGPELIAHPDLVAVAPVDTVLDEAFARGPQREPLDRSLGVFNFRLELGDLCQLNAQVLILNLALGIDFPHRLLVSSLCLLQLQQGNFFGGCGFEPHPLRVDLGKSKRRLGRGEVGLQLFHLGLVAGFQHLQVSLRNGQIGFLLPKYPHHTGCFQLTDHLPFFDLNSFFFQIGDLWLAIVPVKPGHDNETGADRLQLTGLGDGGAKIVFFYLENFAVAGGTAA